MSLNLSLKLSKNILDQKNILGAKKSMVKKDFGKKNIWDEKIFGTKRKF